MCILLHIVFFFQAEDGIRDLVRSRGLGDVYKRQAVADDGAADQRRRRHREQQRIISVVVEEAQEREPVSYTHLTLPTSDLV